MQPGEGERLHSEQRRRFWTIIGWMAALGALVGFAAGLFAAVERDDSLSLVWIAGLAATGVAYIAFAAYGSWRFFRSVDELELADNLWASLFGFYTYALVFPAWWVFGKLQSLPEPNQWVIYVASMTVALGTYLFRKLRFR